MRTRWSLIVGLLAAAGLLPLALVAVPGDGSSARARIAAWALVLVVVAAVSWRPLRRWTMLPPDERKASLRATALAVPAALLLAVTVISIAVAIAVLTILRDPALAMRAALASPFTAESVAYLIVLGVPLVWALRRPTTTAVTAWCARQGIPANPPAVALVRHDLFTVRVARTLGVVAGVAIGYGPMLAYNRISGVVQADPALDPLLRASSRVPNLFDPLTLALVGYLIGALVAERRRRSALAAEGSGAALDTRRVETYTAPLARWLPSGAAGLLVVIAAFRVWIGDGADASAAGSSDVGQAALAAVVLAVVAAILRHWIVRRPQRAADATQLAVDDAFRASTVHATSGAISAVTIAYLLFGLQAVLQAVDVPPAVASAVGAVIGIGGMVLVIGLWLGFGSSHAWRVVRASTDREGIDA
jgi:hypothetical protein